MNRHEGVSCNSCFKGNFRGRRYKCLMCNDYDLCADCYEAGAITYRHTTAHPMQCILARNDLELYYGGEALISIEQPQAYTCPYCYRMGFTVSTLQEHVISEHSDISFEVVCPVCATVSGGNPDLMTDDLAVHLTLVHRSGPRDLISFLNEPVRTRHNARRYPHRRSNMHYSSSGGLSSLSPSSDDNLDPIAELLSQLSGMRLPAPATNTSMQLQLERQQVNVAHQQLERFPRRQLQTITVPGGSTQIQDTVLREPAKNSARTSQFLLPKLLEELSIEPALEEQRVETGMFVQQLLLSSLMDGNAEVSKKLKSINPNHLFGSCIRDRSSKEEATESISTSSKSNE